MNVRSYHTVASLEHAVLEDSFVLGLHIGPTRVVFELEVALLPGHAQYIQPHPGKQHCYAPAELRFEGLVSVQWFASTLRPVQDASGDRDLGNIDLLEVTTAGSRLAGDWGEMIIFAQLPTLVLQQADSHN